MSTVLLTFKQQQLCHSDDKISLFYTVLVVLLSPWRSTGASSPGKLLKKLLKAAHSHQSKYNSVIVTLNYRGKVKAQCVGAENDIQ